MQPPTNTFARKTNGVIEVTDAPHRLRWSFDDLVTADGHRLTLGFSCSLRALPEPAERQFFQETFLTTSPTVAVDDLAAHFFPALRSAAAALVHDQPAETALSDEFRPRWVQTLRAAARPVAFACGIELLPPFEVETGSPTLQKERLEQMQRTASERQAAGQVEHFARAAELLKQWESLRTSAPSITPGQVLEQLNPGDRGAMLQTLLMASAGQTAQPDLWAVTGPYLVRIDVKSDAFRPELFPLPPLAGPLRSVQAVDGRVLVGARDGVFIVDPINPAQAEIYRDPDLTSEYGFSRVTFGPDGVWACHRDGGIVGWRLGESDRPAHALRPPQLGGVANHLLRVRGRFPLVFAIDNQLFGLNPAAIEPLISLASPIVGVLATDDRLILAGENGIISIHDGQTLERIIETRPAGRLIAAALAPWLSSARLLLAAPDGPVCCIGLDDPLVTQYTSPHLGVRAVAGSVGKIAAMTPDRQRIILWNIWDGRRPVGEIYLTGLTKHRIADIAFG
jgi:hypothetical protein